MFNSKHNKKSRKLPIELPVISAVFYIFATALFAFFSSSSMALTVEQESELVYLLKQDCGSCHGLTLQGGLGPALLKKNLSDKPQSYLESVIAYGRAGTPMPPWKDILSPEEISFLASYLLSEKNSLAKPSLSSSDKIALDSQKKITTQEN